MMIIVICCIFVKAYGTVIVNGSAMVTAIVNGRKGTTIVNGLLPRSAVVFQAPRPPLES